MTKESKTIRIESEKCNLLGLFCKFRGKTIKKYIETKIDEDLELKKFKTKIKDLSFQYKEE